MGAVKVYKGIALRQVFERIALRNGLKVCGKCPTRLLTGYQDNKSRLNEVRLKAQLNRYYRVYIGKGPKRNGPCVSR